jgi:Kef-type K+ transport system membrane component KefB
VEIPLLRELGFIVCAAAGMALALRGLRVPAIVAYMLAGLLLGPVLGLVVVSESVDQIAEAGIALLLFLVGLELSLTTVRGLGPVVLVTAGIQISASLGAGLAAALLLGFNAVESTIIGGAVAISSTVVAVKLLEERRALSRTHGRIAVGVLLVQDVVVIIALTLLAGLGGGGEGAASFAGQIARAFGGMAVLSALALLGARWLLARPLLRMASAPEATLVWGLAWCFLFILAAESLHLSVELGAFIAGLGLAQLPAAEELRRRVQPLVDFFVAVFFVTLGIGIDLGSLSDVLLPALVLSALVLLLKPISVFFPVRGSGYGERVAFNAALTLGQVSEFSFILATAALAQGLIDEGVLALVALVGLFTIAISSFAIVRADGFYDRVRSWGLLRGQEATADDEEEAPRRDHVIVVGMNSLGRRIAAALTARGERVLAVDTDPGKLAGLPCETLVGSADSSRVLEEADLQSARLLVSALQIEDSNNLVTYWATRYGVPASVHAFDPSLVEELQQLGAAHLMVSKHDGIRQVATALREQGVID